MGRVPKRGASRYTSLTRYHLSQFAEPSITEVRCCCIATPPVLWLIGKQNPHDDRARYLKRTVQDTRFQSRQGHRPSWDLSSLSLVPPGKRLNSSHHKFRYHLLCTFQPTKHLPLQGCNTVGTIHNSRPDLSRKNNLQCTSHHHISKNSIQYFITRYYQNGRWGERGEGGGESVNNPSRRNCIQV
jgi:hypothetical protein